jgi:hypothetical protein
VCGCVGAVGNDRSGFLESISARREFYHLQNSAVTDA